MASLRLVTGGEADLRQVEGGGTDSTYFPGYGGISISAQIQKTVIPTRTTETIEEKGRQQTMQATSTSME